MQPSQPVVYRSYRPGDLGLIVHKHGLVYSQEYNFNQKFEALVARVAADFLQNYDSTKEHCWVAEQGHEFMGSVAILKDPEQEGTAKLRLLLVDQKARRKGVGTTLVQKCLDFAREAGYESVELWTDSSLISARRIYKNAGFELLQTTQDDPWGVELTLERWKLDLGTMSQQRLRVDKDHEETNGAGE